MANHRFSTSLTIVDGKQADIRLNPWANKAAIIAGLDALKLKMLVNGTQYEPRQRGMLYPVLDDGTGAPGFFWFKYNITNAGLVQFVGTGLTESEVQNLIDESVPAIDFSTILGGVPAEGNTLNKLYTLITLLQSFINGDDINLNDIKELSDAIKAEGDTISLLTGSKVNLTAIYNALDYTATGKVLDARQGKVINDKITALTTGVPTDADTLLELYNKILDLQARVSSIEATPVITPPPPSNLVMDDDYDTLNWAYAPGYPNFTDYGVTTDGVNYVTANGKPHTVGDYAFADGVVGIRVKGTTKHSPSDTIWTTLPFTVAPPLVNLVFTSLFTGITRNVTTNIYTWTLNNDSNAYGNTASVSHRKLMPGNDGGLYMKSPSLGCYLGFHNTDVRTYYLSWKIGMIYGIYPYIIAVDQGSQITGPANGTYAAIRIMRRGSVYTLEGTNNFWASYTVIYTYTYTNTSEVLYPQMDIYNSNTAKLEGAKGEGLTLF